MPDNTITILLGDDGRRVMIQHREGAMELPLPDDGSEPRRFTAVQQISLPIPDARILLRELDRAICVFDSESKVKPMSDEERRVMPGHG